MHRSTATLEAGEEQLVALAAQSDREAFGRLYERHAVRVYRHAYFLTGDQSLAEDITAQTFLNAMQALPRYQNRGVPFVAWLLRIAGNLVINYRKSPKNGCTQLPEVIVDNHRDFSPEASCEALLDGKQVWEQVQKLAPEQRQVIVMRFVDDLPYPHIANVLGKSVGAVRVIQFRALHNLRNLVQRSEQPVAVRLRAS